MANLVVDSIENANKPYRVRCLNGTDPKENGVPNDRRRRRGGSVGLV